MIGMDSLEICFLPLDQRDPPRSRFFRIIGRDVQGSTLSKLTKYYKETQSGGFYILDGIPNPTEPEIARFFDAVGSQFTFSSTLIERHMTVWLGQLRAKQRQVLSQSVMDALDTLKEQGTNENIIKNVYIKFMCWLRSPLGHVLIGMGKPNPSKILFEGNISKYEALFLQLLHLAGCDVWYVNFISEQPYLKADKGMRFSELIQGEVFTPPPFSYTVQQPLTPVLSRSTEVMPPASCVVSLENDVTLNTWMGNKPAWEAVFLPCAKRLPGTSSKLYALFVTYFGCDERSEYRNRLFRLKRALADSPKKWILLDYKTPAPAADEIALFRAVNKNAPRQAMLHSLANCLAPNNEKAQMLLAQKVFMFIMAQRPEQDPVRLFNYGVRLACWLRRYTEALFEGYRMEHQPAIIYYGAITEAEISLLYALAHIGVDVLYFSSDKAHRENFAQHFLPHQWQEIIFENNMPLESFPQREERTRAATTAYSASRELDQLLYSDTGMFRDRQFARSQPVTLKTTYDEVGQLWQEEARYRPSFHTEAGVVYVPNLFSKISGVDKGDLDLYWNHIRAMITEETQLITKIPFLKLGGPSMSPTQARSFLHNGRLDPRALKSSRFYSYDYLPDDTQDYILEKIQALIDYDLIINGGVDLPAAMLSVLMNLDKELLRQLQSFDFTRHIPKILVVDVTEQMFSLEECILLAFLNLVGFDIAVFTPTGYRNLERYLHADSFDTLSVGEFIFDLTIPDLTSKSPVNGSADWLGRLFGSRHS